MCGPTSIALVGIGGYGSMCLSALLDGPHERSCSLVATVDPNPAGCARRPELAARGIPHYGDLDVLYRNHSVDLTVLVSPI